MNDHMFCWLLAYLDKFPDCIFFTTTTLDSPNGNTEYELYTAEVTTVRFLHKKL